MSATDPKAPPGANKAAAGDPTMVDPQVIDTVNQCQVATMQPQVVLTSGAGKAYQMVAQACALAVQDGVDAMRNTSTIANAAAGAAMARYLATGEPRYLEVLTASKALMQDAIADFKAIGETAAQTLKSFPSG